MTEDEYSTKGSYATKGKEFKRDQNYITDRIVADPKAAESDSAGEPAGVYRGE